MEPIAVNTQRLDIGRALIFRVDEWDGTTDLFADDAAGFAHIGLTEGAVEIEVGEEYSDLTTEGTGPAILERYLSGESPSFELGLYPDPTKMALFSPTGRASAGTTHRGRVRVHTLWIVPEQLFLGEDANGAQIYVPITYTTAGGWLKDGVALTAEEQELLDMSIIIWRAHFGRMTPRFQHEDGGKALVTVPVQVLQDLTKPEGCQLFLVMSELADFPTIDVEPEAV